jgi:hypothetical protein
LSIDIMGKGAILACKEVLAGLLKLARPRVLVLHH